MTAPAVDRPAPASWDLVRQAQAGDREAFGALYDRHNTEVYRYIWLRCGNVQLAQDLASDVWERALRSIGNVRPSSSPPIAWLLTIARNRCIDFFRSGRFRMEVVSSDIADADYADPAEDTTRTVEQRADSAMLLAAVRMLPSTQQEVISLTYFVGLANAETAKVMGLSVMAVKQQLTRSRRALADLLRQPREA